MSCSVVVHIINKPFESLPSVGCAGRCHTQCTFDGRPYSSLAGTGGKRGVIVEDNVLCNAQDPYNKQDNILVHEYAHTIKNYCLSQSLKSRVSLNY